MKKISLSLITVILGFIIISSILFSGCAQDTAEPAASEEETASQSESETEESATVEEKEPVTIHYVVGENDPPSMDALRAWVSDFEALYPWITVEIQEGGEDVTGMVLTNIASGAPVDVFNPNFETVYQLTQEGLLLPLDSVVESVGGREAYIFDSLFYDLEADTVVGIPYAEGGQVMWIRTDIFEQNGIPLPSKEGWTWEECYEAAKNAMTDLDGDGKIDVYGIGLPFGQNTCTDAFAQEIMWTNGQAFFDKNNKLVVDSPYTVEAMEFYASLFEFAPPGAVEYSWYEVVDSFTSGSVAIGFYEGRILGRIYNENPELKGKFMTVPIAHNENFGNCTFSSPNYNVVYAKTEHPEECLLWMEFINQPENMAKFLASVPGHMVPETEAAAEAVREMNIPEIVENPDVIDVLWGVSEYAWNPVKDCGGLNRESKTIEKTGIPNIYYHLIAASNYPSVAIQKIVLEGADPEQVVSDMATALQADIDAQ